MEYLNGYERYLMEEKKASPNTLSSYLRDVRQYLSWLEEEGLSPIQASHADVEAYSRSMTARGKSAATVTRSQASLKSFYSWLMEIGQVEENPARGLTQTKVERKLPQVLTGKEVELFLEQPRCVDAKGYRDHAMLELLYATGIRVSEVKHLTVEAARAGKAEISLKGKIRTILLPGKLCRKLLRYAKKQNTASGEIFLTRNRNGMGRRQIWAEMKRLCAAAGVAPSKVFPHNLRHLFATAFYRMSRDIVKLADVLGHSCIETTRIYLMTSGTEHQRQLERLGLVS